MKVATLTPAFFAPLTKMRGAVETLVDEIVLQDERKGDLVVQLYSSADETALHEEPGLYETCERVRH